MAELTPEAQKMLEILGEAEAWYRPISHKTMRDTPISFDVLYVQTGWIPKGIKHGKFKDR